MIDISQFKSQLTSDDIVVVMDSLGADFNSYDQKQIKFRSICHNSTSYKLYYFITTQSFYCFRDAQSWDIIGIVQHVKSCDFNNAISYICSILNISVDNCVKNENLDKWQELKRWLPNADTECIEPLPRYDKRVLSLFDHLYPQDWLDYGISRDSMDKFNIGWYRRLAAISIPVLCNGELVGIRGRFTRKQDIVKGKYKPLTTLDGTTYKFPTNQLFYAYDQNKDYIAKSRKVILFEGEKSCLKADSKGIHNTLAVFGSNVSKAQIRLLLELGVEEVTLGFDSDFVDTKGEDFRFFVAKIKKIAKKINPYFTVYCAYNNQGYDGYKYSPMDFTDEQMEKIFENRVKIS